jgi:hypothetical protein
MTKIYQSIEHIIARIMFFLTIIFLSLVAIILQYLQIDNGLELLPYSRQLISILLILWPFFFLDRILYLIFCNKRTWKSYVGLFLITLLPPLHLAARRCDDQTYIWWDFNWQLVTPSLYEHIEKRFLYPILIFSLFMIPIWIIEIFLPQSSLTMHLLLYHLINMGNALIWGLFTTEFIIMFFITKDRNDYLIRHWLELFIIVLPMLALARFVLIYKYLFITKSTFVLWFVKIQNMLNIYRTRSVLNRIIRILILVDIVKRFYQRKNPEKYLTILRNKLADKEEEIIELKKQINEIELLIEENKKKG